MSLSEWMQKRDKDKYTRVTPGANKKKMPDGMWMRCPSCNQVIYQKELGSNLKVCPKCDWHLRMSPYERIDALFNEKSFKQFDAHLTSKDPLKFKAQKLYLDNLREAKSKTKLDEAVVTGRGKIKDFSVVLAVLDFSFIGGSMGSVVGEKIARAVEKSAAEKLPLIIVSASGGARMQEGMYSLMQMAKTSAAIGRLKQSSIPFISILTHPTTGGVTASFATLADVIIAEPHALIGFAGPRVIEKTIRQRLPKGFQQSEFLLAHGMIDMVVHRKELKATVSRLLDFTTSNQRPETSDKRQGSENDE